MYEQDTDETADVSDRRPNEVSDGRVPIGRRTYLKSGAAATLPLLGSGMAAADNGDGGDGSGGGSNVSPAALQVDYEREPHNIDPAGDPPRFFWTVTGEGRGATQTAYRILVADSASALRDANGNVWDSGRVDSDESAGIVYEGPDLNPDTTYYWAVRLWDGSNEASGWRGSMFTTAIPGTSEYWEGDWIGANLDQIDLPEGFRQDVQLNPLLRTEFDVGKEVREARLHISGIGLNEPYLNGERVGENVLDHAGSHLDFESTVLFSSYDVTELLEQGRNAIGVALGRGRFGEPAMDNGDWDWAFAPWWDDPQLLVQMNIEYADGSTDSVVTDTTWQVTDAPTRYDSLFSGELYDAREESPGWTECPYDTSDWKNAIQVERPGGSLEPQRLPPIRVQEESPAHPPGESGTINPVSRSNPEDDVYVFDMGVNFSGWTRITVEGEAGTEVSIRMGEKLDDDGTVVYDTGLIVPPAQEDQYVLKGEGTETWEASFSYKGFRYVEVKGYPGTPTAEDIEGVVVHSDIAAGNTSDFTCSNDLLNQIHEQTRRAIVNNYHGIPTDTPLYEKNGWTADAHATAQTAFYNFDVARFYEKWFRDMRDGQADHGEVPTIVPTTGYSVSPNPGWDSVEGPVPAWDAAYFIMPWLMYRHKGDERVLSQQYELMKEYMSWFREQFEGMTPNLGLGDWVAPEDAPNETHITATCYYYLNLDILANTARVLGNESDAEQYESLREQVMTAFNEEFYDAEGGYYQTEDVESFAQTSNILPLAFGMVPDDRIDPVVDSLVHNIMEVHDGHLYTGLLGTKHILPVLTEHGHHDVAYTVATQTTYPSWGHWIVNGMTSLLEAWPLDARSRNHHFLGMIDEWFYRYLAGIREPAEPAFEHVVIAPLPVEDLDSAAGRTETVRGLVESSWERTDDGIRLAVTVPANTTATVRVPATGDGAVRLREGGKTIWNNGNATRPDHSGVESVSREGDAVAVETGSGEYEFELERIGN